MKKRLLVFFTTLILALGLVACGNDSDVTYGGYSADAYDTVAKVYMNYVYSLEEDQYEDATEYLLNYGFSQYGDVVSEAGLPAFMQTGFVGFDQLIESYSECKDTEVGEFIGYEDIRVEKSGKTITATLVSDFSVRNLKTTFVFKANDVDAGPTAVDIEPVYTLSETMQKAALNTVMGILIVFCMLILMSGVIKCFEIIPRLERKAKDKKENDSVVSTPAVVTAAPVKNETDDLQLVAVIAAAIAASTGASTDSFVVRSIKKRY